ncbi:MAG TPA: STAS domain-containing protein [Acidimicrobiales bacterium]|nr:STAS domain-containing protein [Acidimicrobiales bacterium]
MDELAADRVRGAAEVRAGAPGTTVVALRGEIDISNVDELAAVISDRLPEVPGAVVVDASGLDFLDSSGIALLLRLSARADTLVIRSPTHVVRRVIGAAGLTDVLGVEP